MSTVSSHFLNVFPYLSRKPTSIVHQYLGEESNYTINTVVANCLTKRLDLSSLHKSAKDSKTPSCSICLQDVTYPVILGCGHVYDLDCISDWARKNNTCPQDRTIIDIGKIQYAEGCIRKVGAVFTFAFLSGEQIDPIVINVHSSVQRLKSLISLARSIKEKNLIVAAFSPHANKEPRSYFCIVSGKVLCSDTLLSDNGMRPEGIYKICSLYKLAQYGLPCDRCFSDPAREQTCNHPDEVVDENDN
jgi:hypothetical protein